MQRKLKLTPPKEKQEARALLSDKNKRLELLESKIKTLGPQGEMIIEKFQNVLPVSRRMNCLIQAVNELKALVEQQRKYKERPVDIETFINSPQYLNIGDEIFPKVMEELKKMTTGQFTEIVLTGGIGSAKTTIALLLIAYQLYLMSCLRDPQKEYGIQRAHEIVIIFQSLNAAHAKSVDYNRFKRMIAASPYFKTKFMYDRTVDSELRFPGNIIVKPVAGGSTAAIGQNVISGILDEVNFMKITAKSKHSRDSGTYDQAWENYNSIKRRRESRFMKKGVIPGILCLVSSKRYPGEFTDVKMEEAAAQPEGEKTIYVYDKRIWQIAPEGRFTGETFRLFCGDTGRKPRIVSANDNFPEEDKHLLMDIPEEYRGSFERDLLGSMRDIAGVSTMALEPYIIDIDKVRACFDTYDSVLSQDSCDFINSDVYIYPKRIKRRDQPRFIHIDLAMTGDSAGMACGYVAGFVNVTRDEEEGIVETLPVICIDFMLEIFPPKNEEIPFHRIRSLVYKLVEQGMNIKWISFDQFQSTDSIQMLSRKGFLTGVQSMDRKTVPYDITKVALMDNRVMAPMHDKCYTELISLERNVKKNKIDHRPGGSKDVSDSLAGVVYGLTMRREVWVKHGIPLVAIPGHLVDKANTYKNSIDGKDVQTTSLEE